MNLKSFFNFSLLIFVWYFAKWFYSKNWYCFFKFLLLEKKSL